MKEIYSREIKPSNRTLIRGGIERDGSLSAASFSRFFSRFLSALHFPPFLSRGGSFIHFSLEIRKDPSGLMEDNSPLTG